MLTSVCSRQGKSRFLQLYSGPILMAVITLFVILTNWLWSLYLSFWQTNTTNISDHPDQLSTCHPDKFNCFLVLQLYLKQAKIYCNNYLLSSVNSRRNLSISYGTRFSFLKSLKSLQHNFISSQQSQCYGIVYNGMVWVETAWYGIL